MIIYIKNMACLSCKIVVKDILNDLGITTTRVELGEIETKNDISSADKKKLNLEIKKIGMELLEKKQGILIEKMKKFIIAYVCNCDNQSNVKFSILLSEELNFSYSYLASIFSEVETTTIEKYMIALKIEHIKDLIIFGDDTFSEIAYKLNYSSVAHLSTQFKKSTGLTPSHYKALKEKRRQVIGSI